MTAEELNKGKELIVNLLNSLFSKYPDYTLEYDYDDTGILVNLADKEKKLPLINRNIMYDKIYRNFAEAKKYFPKSIYLWNDLDIVFSYNGKTLEGKSTDTIIGDSVLECFDSSIESVKAKPIKFPTTFVNIGSIMGKFYITSVNNTVTKTDINPSDAFIYFFTYLIPDYLLLSNEKGESVKVTSESLREFYLNGGEDGGQYDFTPEEILESLIRGITFAQTEQYDTEVAADFYNCLRNTGFDWGTDIYEEYYPLYEILILGINDMVISDWGVFGEAGSGEFEIFEDLFNFLNRK